MEIGEIKRVAENRYEVRGNKTMGKLLQKLAKEIPRRCWDEWKDEELGWFYYLDVQGKTIQVNFRYGDVKDEVHEVVQDFIAENETENRDGRIKIRLVGKITSTGRLDVAVRMDVENSTLWGVESQSFSESEWREGKVEAWVAEQIEQMKKRVAEYDTMRADAERIMKAIAKAHGAELNFSASWEKDEE